ncbi:MAG: UPF0280 family protein [Alphaproteobacteria bacterium]
MGALRALLPDGRLHLQHGPIDLILDVTAPPAAVAAAHDRAAARFEGLLAELVAELPLLRRPAAEGHSFAGSVARRMAAAVRPHRGVFVTPMAAVAGAVADEILAASVGGDPAIRRAYVNDGGDIAIHLAPGERFRIGMADLASAALGGLADIPAESPVRGIATSGQGGRSFSLGIAEAVTVLAADAAAADAAATLIANAVNLDHPGIGRRPARDLDPDSDLGDRLVTVAVPPLTPAEADAALASGASAAERMRQAGLIAAAALRLQGRDRIVGGVSVLSASS